MTTFVLALALQCLFPIFDSSLQSLGISIANPESQPSEYVMTLNDSEGTASQQARVTIADGRQDAFLLSNVFNAGAPTAWLQVDSSASGCYMFFTDDDKT